MFAQSVVRVQSETPWLLYLAIGAAALMALIFVYFWVMKPRGVTLAPQRILKSKVSEDFTNRDEVVAYWDKLGVEAEKEATYQSVLDLRRKAVPQTPLGYVAGPK